MKEEAAPDKGAAIVKKRGSSRDDAMGPRLSRSGILLGGEDLV